MKDNSDKQNAKFLGIVKEDDIDIDLWINRIIKGFGGFESWEDHEMVVFHNSREEGIAAFVIRCLSNPECKGSSAVISAILEQRQNKSGKDYFIATENGIADIDTPPSDN